MNRLFVYGLLKPDQRLYDVVAPYVLRSTPGTTTGRLYDAGVPAARFDEDGEIDGVVLWLDEDGLDHALRILDDLEDEGTEYERRVVKVLTRDGTLDAFAYEYLLQIDGAPYVGRSWLI